MRDKNKDKMDNITAGRYAINKDITPCRDIFVYEN